MEEMSARRPSMTHTLVNKRSILFRSNVKLARRLWSGPSIVALKRVQELTKQYGFSVAGGDLQFLDSVWYVTHAGLLRLSSRRKCAGIRTAVVDRLSDAAAKRWVFKATVYKSPGSKGFVGYGDADPSNTSPLVRGAEMRVAETRAVNRALRKAYGIGLCSVEELRFISSSTEPADRKGTTFNSSNGNGSDNGQPRLRDRLCLLIRQYQLDATLVKSYAADFCGTEALRDASRDLVESFITKLSEWAAKDRDGLICHLNSFVSTKEVNS
jgi:hypothetical protein